jgi:hypothetical protein
MGETGTGKPCGGCGFTWQRSRAADASLGIEPVGLDTSLSADVDNLAFIDVREKAVQQAYPDRDVGGWDIWGLDAKVESIWAALMAPYGYDAAHAERIRAYAAGNPKSDPAAITKPMSLWPMAVVGVVAIGIFVATLSINPKRR